LSEPLVSNCRAFSRRFPDLAGIIGLDDPARLAALMESIPGDYALAPAASGDPTLSVRGAFLHSRYNPKRDAERELAALEGKDTKQGMVFAGMGLAYLPELYAASRRGSTIALVEPDLFILLLALASRPLDALLAHPDLAIVAGTDAREASSVLERMDFDDLPVHEPPALTGANRPWFDEFSAIRKRNREKREINANTLRRFGGLWLSNMCRNFGELKTRPGIGAFRDLFPDIPVLVLAAGPSLDRILPELPGLARRCVIVAVDTAARACVRAGVEPDFIVLVDPQYWNWRHLDGVKSPSSVLITESAAWPAVFRFPTRATCLCSSLFPLGKFIESRTGSRGELGAGGSVSTTAWDFARHLGSRRIVMAGLDLGFPERKTHFTGSVFEERTHATSSRLDTAESAGYRALYGAGPYPVADYAGNAVLTDKRLILYAWWFESRLAAYPDHATSTVTPEGVRIPGFSVESLSALASLSDARDEIERRLAAALGNIESPESEAFDKAVGDLRDALADIAKLAETGIAECDRWLSASARANAPRAANDLLVRLDAIDREILGHPAKEVAAMVFGAATEPDGSEGQLDPIAASRRLYGRILEAAEKNSRMIEKFD
jgi:hypothetical protein